MSNKKKNMQEKRAILKRPLTPEESAKRTKRIIIIAVSAVLALAVLFGIILGIVAVVRNSSYLMRLERVGIDKGVAAFLVSIYKHDYMTNMVSKGVSGVEDTDEFWSQPAVTGTIGDVFDYEAEEYLKQIVAANALFDKYATLTKEDEEKIALATAEVLNYKASGSKATFNSMTESMGFDFKDFQKGSEMLYKLGIVYSTIFGESGSRMQSDFAEYCERFYNRNYIRAKILIIRTEDTYKLDENGEMIKGDDGAYETHPLTAEEKQARLDDIAALDGYVNDITSDPNNTVALTDFNNRLNKVAEAYNENVISGVKNGFYLCADSQYTKDMGMKDIIDEAFNLEIGEIYTYETGAAVADGESEDNGFSFKCYVYRMEKEDKAYANNSLEHFFYDFNALSSAALYEEMVTEYAKDVTVKDEKWDAFSPVAIPRNYDYRVKVFG